MWSFKKKTTELDDEAKLKTVEGTVVKCRRSSSVEKETSRTRIFDKTTNSERIDTFKIVVKIGGVEKPLVAKIKKTVFKQQERSERTVGLNTGLPRNSEGEVEHAGLKALMGFWKPYKKGDKVQVMYNPSVSKPKLCKIIETEQTQNKKINYSGKTLI